MGTRLTRLVLGILLLVGVVSGLHLLAPGSLALGPLVLSQGPILPQTLELKLSPFDEAGPHTIIIPSAGTLVGLEAGSQNLKLEGTRGPSGFGFRSQSYLVPLPPGAQGTETLLRIRLGEDLERLGPPRVFVAPAAIAQSVVKTQRDWAWRNQVAGLTIALLSALVFTLLIGGVSSRISAGAMAALSYLALAQTLLREREVGEFFGHLTGGAEYLLAIWIAFALTRMLRAKTDTSLVSRGSLTLLFISSLLVLINHPDFSPLLFWLPAIVAAPFVALTLVHTWRASIDPAATSVELAAIGLAIAAAALGLARAAAPGMFNEAYALASMHSLGLLPMLAVASIALVRQSIDAWRTGVAKLKEDYAAQSVELGRVGAMLQEEARRRMLFEERSRITRDMHDGIGGRLLSLLIRVRSGRLEITDIEREVQESLNDLRLIVDSLDSAGETLDTALDAFRDRVDRQISGAGMDMEWVEHEDGFGEVTLEPQAMLDLFRIMQEAVSNAINHSGASKIRIEIKGQGERLRISIADDGRGLTPGAQTGRGKGLKNMHARAARLDAELSIAGDEGKGTHVSMELPVKCAVQSSDGSSSQPS